TSGAGLWCLDGFGRGGLQPELRADTNPYRDEQQGHPALIAKEAGLYHAVAHGAATGQRRANTHHQPTDDGTDRKSTRLNSSHVSISYAVFCLKKESNNDYR